MNLENSFTPMLVVAVALAGADGRILMQQRSLSAVHGGLWEFPEIGRASCRESGCQYGKIIIYGSSDVCSSDLLAPDSSRSNLLRTFLPAMTTPWFNCIIGNRILILIHP